MVASKKGRPTPSTDPMSLLEWVSIHYEEDEMRSVFINMDKAMKYLHDRGYYVAIFHPSQIYVLNGSDEFIKFLNIEPFGYDIDDNNRKIKEDIFNSSFIQVALYTKSLEKLKPEYLKEHFDDFAQFLPPGDVPYYRGVIQRDADIYFCEFVLEKSNRDLIALAQQFGEEVHIDSRQSQKSPDVNELVNQRIYGLDKAAFINFAFLPALIMIIILAVSIVAWVFSLI